jgi:hypothetical protein
LSVFTIPIYIFTALPPVEIVNEVPEEIVEEVLVPTVEQIETNKTEQVPVNQTILVPINITQEIELNRTIELNVTEGGSVFLSQQAAPQLIDTDIVVVVDTSGSMVGDRINTAKQAINTLLTVINQSSSVNITNDRVALVTFAGSDDGDWTNDSIIETDLDFANNQTHLNDVFTKTNALTTGGWTDMWAGLNNSLQLLLDNKRDTPTLQSIILLTDGVHQTGPWGSEVDNDKNYTGFMQLPNNFSLTPDGAYSESPVAIARANGVQIYTIGLFEGVSFGFDQNFLMNISLDPDFGTFGDFFIGNDTLSITEAFLKSRDGASGWKQLLTNETIAVGNGTQQMFSFNVTEEIRRLKWDVNWNDSLITFNATLTDPNGTIINLADFVPDNIISLTEQNSHSFILDYPLLGIWNFNITWSNITFDEEVKSRLATFEPPVLIQSVSQLNVTTSKIVDNVTIGTNSITFELNVTNKNPIFSYTNITGRLLLNASEFNHTTNWNPAFFSELITNETITFELNITLLEPVFLQGQLFFLINSSEGYFDAFAQPISLDYRINTEDTVIETYFENQTITVFENQTIVVLEETIIYETQDVTNLSTELSTGTGYSYNRQTFNIIKWIGLIGSFLVLSLISVLYLQSQESKFRQVVTQFRNTLFTNRSVIEATLVSAGIDPTQLSLDDELAQITSLDEFSTAIYMQTGVQLSPESLIETASGVNVDQIAGRISYVTGITQAEVLQRIRGSDSLDEIISEFGLSYEHFIEIISRDEKVDMFQNRIHGLIGPDQAPSSSIGVSEDIDVVTFRSRLRST